MEEAIKVTAETITFEVDEHTKFELKPIQALRHLEALETEVKDKGGDHYTFLDAVCEYVLKRCGVTIDEDTADWVYARLGLWYLQKKSKQKSDMLSMLKSPISME